MTVNIGVLGANGRMGRMLQQALAAGGAEAILSAAAGRNDDKEAVFSKADAVIDFTTPDALAAHAELAARHGRPLVVGTTGLDAAAQAALAAAAEKAPILQAANMSVGVTMLLALVEDAAKRLGADFDIEIFEAHHRHKVDAPSGTALALGRAAAKGRGLDFDAAKTVDREGVRASDTIGFSVFRGGDVVGEHTVTFAGAGERVELVHKATDRAIFARGAIRAALWLTRQKPGLYTMRDVLGL